jgi:hypothetical protein
MGEGEGSGRGWSMGRLTRVSASVLEVEESLVGRLVKE